MNKIVVFILLLLSVYTLSALTLEEAKAMALEKNSRYLAQKNAYNAARWGKQQALSGLLPSLTLSGSYVYLDPAVTIQSGTGSTTLNHDSRSAALTLTQPLFMGGKLWQAYRISSISAEISKLSLENQRLAILNEVESKYLNVLQLQELLSISEKDLTSSRQNLAVVVVRYESGVLSQADYLRVKARVASKEVALIQAQTSLELAKQDFLNFLGLSEAVTLQAIQPSYAENELGYFAEYTVAQTEAFTRKAAVVSKANNLSLKTASASVVLSKKAYSIAKGSFLPTVTLSAIRSYKENGIDRYEFDATNTLALSASVPILPMWNNYSASRKAFYDVQKSRQDFETAADGIDLVTRSAALNLISAARQMKAAEVALRYTEQTYQQMQERFKNNMLSVSDLQDGEIMLQSAQVSFTNAFYNYLKAKSALLIALGTDEPETISSLME